MIGDKKGGNTSRTFADVKSRDRLRDITTVVGVPVRFLHVIRNPFDNIATMAIRSEANRQFISDVSLQLYRWYIIISTRKPDIFMHTDCICRQPDRQTNIFVLRQTDRQTSGRINRYLLVYSTNLQPQNFSFILSLLIGKGFEQQTSSYEEHNKVFHSSQGEQRAPFHPQCTGCSQR